MIKQAKTTSSKKKSKNPLWVIATLICFFSIISLFQKCGDDGDGVEFITITKQLQRNQKVYFDFGEEIQGRRVNFTSPSNNVDLIITTQEGKQGKPFTKNTKIIEKYHTGIWCEVLNKNAEIKITFKKNK